MLPSRSFRQILFKSVDCLRFGLSDLLERNPCDVDGKVLRSHEAVNVPQTSDCCGEMSYTNCYWAFED